MVDFYQFLCMLRVVVARSSSDGVAIRYALPVLWMTLPFHSMGQLSTTLYFSEVRQVAAPVRRQTTSICLIEFIRLRHGGGRILRLP